MARRKKSVEPPHAEPAAASSPAPATGPITHLREQPFRILIVAKSRMPRSRLAARICDISEVGECVQTDCPAAAQALAGASRFDLCLISTDLGEQDALALSRTFSVAPAHPLTILTADEPGFDLAVSAMRSGAIDLLHAKATVSELHQALRSAFARIRQERRRSARVERLTRVCHKLNDARHEVTQHVSSLCNDMVNAYQELAGQVNQLTIASEFNSLIRQELDVESVLRTALEYILAQAGPTNAAVFLPGNSSDYSLGAYVNYDVAKDALDMTLEHLCGFVPRRMEGEHELKVASGEIDLRAIFGENAHWLGDCAVVTFACHHEGECLGVGILFRDKRNPFPAGVLQSIQVVSQLFGRQLARVIHVHHRHLPKDQWGGFGRADEGDDDIDLAA